MLGGSAGYLLFQGVFIVTMYAAGGFTFNIYALGMYKNKKSFRIVSMTKLIYGEKA